MNAENARPPWDSDDWLEQGDNAWRRGLRWQQAWWRETQLGLPAGHFPGRDRAVVSMLPDTVALQPNLMTQQARSSAEQAIRRLTQAGGAGIINQDRLRRNLLSSQPLCFNVFGHHSHNPNTLLPWVREHAPTATRINRIELEWAPANGALGASAFDAFIEYELPGGALGFLGVECKYAEALKEAQRKPAADKYKKATTESAWQPDAATALDRHGLRQLWYNTLLVHTVRAQPQYKEGTGVVVACAADKAAQAAVQDVQAQLADTDDLIFSPLEGLVGSVETDDAWQSRFYQRYLDFTPIQHLLPSTDPRKHN